MIIVVEETNDPITIEAIRCGLSPKDNKIMGDCVKSSSSIWVGMIDGKIACVWGVVVPTLLSTAYLWLWTSDIVKEHPFIFIRRAQMVVQDLLENFNIVVGVCEAEKENSVRWLKMLGAKFSDPENGLRPFTIRKAS